MASTRALRGRYFLLRAGRVVYHDGGAGKFEMEQDLRRFARRILLLHLVLLIGALAVVYVASREVYESAHDQALEQASKQQLLLASQTANGLRGYYDAIFGDLDLLKPVPPDEEELDDRVPEDSDPADLYAKVLRTRPSPMLSSQLNGRVSHLALVQKGHHWIHPIGEQASNPPIQELVRASGKWIDSVDKPTISPLEQFGDRGFNLIGVPLPMGTRRDLVLIASVPVRAASKRFFDEVNRSRVSGALLLDERMTIMAASRPQLIGTSASLRSDPQVKTAMAALSRDQGTGTEQMKTPFRIGGEDFQPSLVSVEPVRILDKTWYVVIASRLSDVDAVVSRLFRRAVMWAICVAASMTAILVSTAVALIRNRMRTDRLRHEMLDRELKQAREIQLAWLPQRGMRSEALDVATANHPASRISGDFYNFFDLPDGRTCVVIGDVTGHGISAAFLMATTQLLVRNTMPQCRDPGHCLEEINRQLCTQMFNGQFVTLQVLVLDAERGRIEIATAGHPHPLLSEGSGFRPLELEPNLILGVEKNTPYAAESFELPPHSTLLLYTDGVVDAQGPAGERFGIDRLRSALSSHVDGAQSVVDSAIGAVNRFRGESPLTDDLTLVAIQLQPHGAQKPVMAG